MRPSASPARALSAPGSAPARRTSGKTIPSGSERRAASRCSGSTRWWSLPRARRCAPASASCALWVNALTSIFDQTLLLPRGWWRSGGPAGLERAGLPLVQHDGRRVGDQVAAVGAVLAVQLLPVAPGLGAQF